MSDQPGSRDGNLRVALTTWVYALHAAGAALADPEVAQACAGVAGASDSAAGDTAGKALIELVAARVDRAGSDPASVRAVAKGIVGETALTTIGGKDREERLHRIRTYQFAHGVPWLARIVERHGDGSVGPSWLLIERVTDRVRVMDPNPWDDVDEERTLPLADFQVLWELDGCTNVAIA